MSTFGPLQAAAPAASSKRAAFPQRRTSLLQRKCACGKSAAAGVKCSECEEEKKYLQRRADDRSSGQPLAIGASNDPLEHKAEQIADQVMAEPAHPGVSGSAPHIQRLSEQTMGIAETAPASVDRVLSRTGTPLAPGLRLDMEQRFGHDFSQVRVHSGSDADESARDVSAHAYTVGRNIVFGAGRFAPGTHEGRRLLAHELTHVVQQSGPAVIQRQPEDGVPAEPQLTRPQEIALSRSSPGEFTGQAQPLELSLYNFGIDVAHPKSEHLAVLTELGGFLNATATVPIVIRILGFADSSGNEQYNYKLSMKRASAVQAVLQPKTTQRISITAYGETNPAATNDTVAGRSRNRRVDIRFADLRPPTPRPLPRPKPTPPGQQPPTPEPQPPGGGKKEKDHAICDEYPLLCGIGVTPFFLPLICLVAPEVCLAVACLLAPALCIPPPPPPPPPKPPEKPPKHDDGGRPIVQFLPDVRSANTPLGMNDRIGLRAPVNLMAVVANPPAATAPITIAVDGAGPNGGQATVNGQAQVQIITTTPLSVLGTLMSAENFAYNPYLQLAAWWGNDLVGESNRFSVSAIAENWTTRLESASVAQFGYDFYVKMDWDSDSGAYADLDACRYVELVGVVEESGGMTGMGAGRVNDPNDVATANFHPVGDTHGTEFQYAKTAGHSRLKQLYRIRDMRSNSGWAPSADSGFEIERRFERDPENPRCWRLVVEKKGASVTVGGVSSGAGAGRAQHTFRNLNCDPPPHDEPPTLPTPTPDKPPAPTPVPSGPLVCDKAELATRVDLCIAQAKQGAIDCTLGLFPVSGGWGGVGAGFDYLACLEAVREALLECDRRAKADTKCPDNGPPPSPPRPDEPFVT